MIYHNVLGIPDPDATVSAFGGGYPNSPEKYYCMNSVSDAPSRRWPYSDQNITAIVAELEADGWDCVIKKNGLGEPFIACTHRETLAAAEAEQITPVGEGEPGYIRFGAPPKSGYSTNKITGEAEPGVSVYRAIFYKNCYVTEIPHYSQGTYIFVSNRPAYRVWGEEVGTGSDGEPCLRITKKQKL